MAITLLNPLDRTSPTFRADVDALFSGGLNTAIAQMNDTQASMSEMAAGGAYAFAYVFDSATADADPGPGKLRLSSATQNAATVMRIDVLNQAGVSLAGLFDALQSVTSSIKGAVRIVKQADPTKWLLFDVASISAGAGYRNATLAYRAGSVASPFANGDALIVYIDRNGDSAVPGVLELISSASISTPVANIDYLSLFNDAYEKYFIEVVGLTPTVTAGDLRLVLINESGTIITSGYNNLATAGYATINSGGNAAQRAGDYCNLTIELKSVRNTAEVKGIDIRGFFTGNSPITVYGVSMNGSLSATNTKVNGFRLYWGNGANFARGYVKIYGLKAA
jgi:hypothetical protein